MSGTGIMNLPSNWRVWLQPASFRGALFFVDTDAHQGGRRVAMHEYPKRDIGYAEDMGKKANRYTVQGYLVGHPDWTSGASTSPVPGGAQHEVNYLDLKNALVAALEADGPGMLRLPLPYLMRDVNVMVNQYAITEHRERGGMCTVEMDFVEYGDPAPASRGAIDTASTISTAAQALEQAMLQVNTGEQTPSVNTEQAFASALGYYTLYGNALSAAKQVTP